MKHFTVPMIYLILVSLFLAGCGSQEFGSGDFNQKTINIGTILRSPKAFEGKIVRLKGKIITECPTGCWIDLKDETGLIYVDFNPSGFAIPQRVGKTAYVKGKVIQKNDKTIIIGEGVKIE